MRVLVIDNNGAATELMLKSSGFSVYLTDLGEEGVDLAKLYDYDAVVLDVTLRDMIGFEVIRRIRAAKIKTPILVLSAMALVDGKVRALDLGADDYLTKPFEKAELVARLHALVRRSAGQLQSIITTGNLAVNLSTKTLEVDGREVKLTGREYQLIELLSLRKGMTMSKGAIMGHLYGGMDEPEEKIVDVFVCKLRAKLKRFNGHPVETVWGRGYVLRDAPPVSVSMASEVAAIIEDAPAGWNARAFGKQPFAGSPSGRPGAGSRGARGGEATAAKRRAARALLGAG